MIFLPVPNLKFSLDKSSLVIFDNKSLLFGPKIPKHISSSVISLNSTSVYKYLSICALSCVLTAAELIIQKLFYSIVNKTISRLKSNHDFV